MHTHVFPSKSKDFKQFLNKPNITSNGQSKKRHRICCTFSVRKMLALGGAYCGGPTTGRAAC